MSNKEKLLASAQKFLAKGQVPRAIKEYEKLVELDSRDIRHRQKLADLYSRARQNGKAFEAFEFVAKHYADNGFYLKAIAVYKQMQKLDASRVEIYHRLAELNAKQGLVGNAMAEYRTLVAHYERQGMVPEAVDVLHLMKELEPENLNIRVKIIETYLQGKLKDQGRGEMLETIELLTEKKDFARQLKLSDFFLPHFPEDRELQACKARALLHLGEPAAALELLKKTAVASPDADLRLMLAEAHRRLGDYISEEEVLRGLKAAAPSEIFCRHIRSLLSCRRFEEALERLEAAKETFLAAAMAGELRELYEPLKGELPGNETVQRTLLAIYENTAEGDKYLDMMEESVEPEASMAPSESEKASEGSAAEEDLPESAEPEVEVQEYPEEIPLEFLEGFEGRDLSAAEVKGQSPKEASSVPQDTELEMELELDLDLDLDEVTGEALAAGASGAAARVGDEEGTAPGGKNDPEAAEPLQESGDFFDLRTALLEEDAPSETEAEPVAAVKKKSIRTEVDVDDPESHYNLGIAYKEMGLTEDAIKEFDKGMAAPGRKVACLTLKGLCLTEMGHLKAAEAVFLEGLGTGELDPEERMSLLFELGLLYEAGERPQDALKHFQAVAEIDLFFRGVGEKLESLRHSLGLTEAGENDTAAGGNKDRVSYI